MNTKFINELITTMTAPVRGGLITTLLIFSVMAHAECAAPDIYTMGTGINLSGLCTSISTGEIAVSTASIDAATVETAATQAKSFAMQAEQLAQQVLAAQNAVIQAELLVREFEENPLEVVAPDVNQLLANQQRIDKLANDIAKNSSAIGTNALNELEHPSTIGLGQGSRFQIWSDTRRQEALNAYELANRYLKDAPKRNANMNKLINSSAAAQGDTANLKVMSSALTQMMVFLQSMQETLNKIMTSQASETGKHISDEITTAKAQQAMATKGLGDKVDIPLQDSYKGPGTSSSKPF